MVKFAENPRGTRRFAKICKGKLTVTLFDVMETSNGQGRRSFSDYTI
jgi:hypothetical protein